MVVILTPYRFESISFRERALHLVWGVCQLPDLLHSIGLRWVKGFLMNVQKIKNPLNDSGERGWANLARCLLSIDPSREIAETRILSWR